MKKLAVIRDNKDESCPFGLPISWACSNIGGFIHKMALLDVMGSDSTPEEKKQIAAANQKLMSWALMMGGEQPKRCFYAGMLFPEKPDKVECNFGDTAAGIDEKNVLLGSPFYSKIFSGIGLDGMYSYPLGFYADKNISRNLFYGIYSIQGSNKYELIKKAIDVIDTRNKEFLQLMYKTLSTNKIE
jgi:hypothetical protein